MQKNFILHYKNNKKYEYFMFNNTLKYYLNMIKKKIDLIILKINTFKF